MSYEEYYLIILANFLPYFLLSFRKGGAFNHYSAVIRKFKYPVFKIKNLFQERFLIRLSENTTLQFVKFLRLLDPENIRAQWVCLIIKGGVKTLR